MSWGNVLVTDSSVAPHHYSVREPNDLEAWLEVLAAEYVRLRSAFKSGLPELLEFPGVGAFSAAEIQARVVKATVPKADYKKGNFSVLRSDLSEVAAYLILENVFGTEIAFKLVRDRELKKLPGRGIDAIGIESDEKLALVLTEVKFSNEKCAEGKAPQVVDTSADCMRTQHRGHLSDLDRTIEKLYDCARRCTNDSERDKLLAAALYLEQKAWDKVEIISCCVLVRPKCRQTNADFGTFRNSPLDYSPSRVRFLIWKLPGDMESILEAWSQAVDQQVTKP